jgi:hypothetical protein
MIPLIEQDLVVGTILTVNDLFILIYMSRQSDFYLVLEVGNGGMTDIEYMTHFSLWSITKAPLIIGSDVTNISAATLATLTNPEVIAVNQDPLGIQGKKIIVTSSQSSNASGLVVIAPCSSASSSSEPARFQWTYNPEDGSIRSVFDERCLSIAHCNRGETPIVLNECQIDDPQAQCQGRNQQWTIDTSNRTILSRMNQFW